MDAHFLALLAAVVVGVNFALSGLHKGLEVIKDKTESKADDKIYAALGSVIGFLSVIADWLAPRSSKSE